MNAASCIKRAVCGHPRKAHGYRSVHTRSVQCASPCDDLACRKRMLVVALLALPHARERAGTRANALIAESLTVRAAHACRARGKT